MDREMVVNGIVFLKGIILSLSYLSIAWQET